MIYKIGNYEVHKKIELGRGMYSIVYKGYGPEGIVAIKKINKTKMSFKILKMLDDEINIMKFIKENPHENIVKCHNIIDDIDTIYIILEYCDNDLKNILKKQIKEQYAKQYYLQIINGLNYLHNNSIIHRDIKPSNILLTNDNKTIKICDFGFAKKNNISNIDKISASVICGSPLYMAPEIFKNKEYGFNTDIWASGIILFEMLFGYHPLYQCKIIDDLTSSLENFILEIPTNSLSQECIIFLKLLLNKNNTKRLSCTQIITHEWLNNITYDNIEIICNAKSHHTSTTSLNESLKSDSEIDSHSESKHDNNIFQIDM
jgi:myosin-light-chain kinase